jgi:hypothetical protein
VNFWRSHVALLFHNSCAYKLKFAHLLGKIWLSISFRGVFLMSSLLLSTAQYHSETRKQTPRTSTTLFSLVLYVGWSRVSCQLQGYIHFRSFLSLHTHICCWPQQILCPVSWVVPIHSRGPLVWARKAANVWA